MSHQPTNRNERKLKSWQELHKKLHKILSEGYTGADAKNDTKDVGIELIVVKLSEAKIKTRLR